MTETILEKIIFAMEDQNNDYVLDTVSGSIFPADDIPDGDVKGRPLSVEKIPAWSSRDGFSLMDRFADTVSDPSVRIQLKGTLAKGKGVFRSFKDILDQNRGLEERWFDFKTATMHKKIESWYQAIREAHGLERLGPEPDELGDLVLSDYSLLRLDGDAGTRITAMLEESRNDVLERFPEPLVHYEFERLFTELKTKMPSSLRYIAAENASGERDGIAIANIIFMENRSFCRLLFLYVKPEHRNRGLGKALVESMLAWCREDGIIHLVVDIPFLGEDFQQALERSGHVPFGTRFLLSTVD